MADLDLLVTLNRDLLGLDPLILSDHDPYYVASSQFFGGTVTWDRQVATSRWVDGDVTVSRRRGNVTEQLTIEVVAYDERDMRALIATLVEAFSQDRFTLTVAHGTAIYAYDCEAADVTNASWTTPRLAACQGAVSFSVPRRPLAVAGV